VCSIPEPRKGLYAVLLRASTPDVWLLVGSIEFTVKSQVLPSLYCEYRETERPTHKISSR